MTPVHQHACDACGSGAAFAFPEARWCIRRFPDGTHCEGRMRPTIHQPQTGLRAEEHTTMNRRYALDTAKLIADHARECMKHDDYESASHFFTEAREWAMLAVLLTDDVAG